MTKDFSMPARRPFAVIIAFLLAVLVVIVLLAIGTAMSEADLSFVERVQFFGGAYVATGYGPATALALSLGAVVLAEVVRIRNVLYYVIGGALIGFVSAWSVDLSFALENTTDIAPISFAKTIATAAGIAGGVVYWFIAARREPRG